MQLSEVKRMQEEKDYLMRSEGKHPANYNEADRYAKKNEGVDYNSHGVEMQ